MKKVISMVMSMVLLIVMVILFASCGNQNKFIGQWTTTVDITDNLKDLVKEIDSDLAEYVDFYQITVSYTYTFNDDGTYSLEINENDFKENWSDVRDDFIDGLDEYYIDIAKADMMQEGENVTTEDVYNAVGDSIEELAIKTGNEVFGDETYELFVQSLENRGTYKVKDSKLYTTFTDENGNETTDYEEFEIISDSEIKLTSSNGEVGTIYPLILKKN